VAAQSFSTFLVEGLLVTARCLLASITKERIETSRCFLAYIVEKCLAIATCFIIYIFHLIL
jgi:hypothetical protein